MEDLFRMVLLRPAVAQDKKRPSIDLTQNSKYQKDLRDGLGSNDPRNGARTASRAFLNLKRFIGDPNENPFDDRLEKLEAVLGRMQNVTPDNVRKAVEKIFGHSVADIVAADNFADTMSRLRDSIVAIKFLQEEQARPLEELVGQLRLMELIVALDDDAAFPEDADALRVARFRTLQLPDEATITSALSTRKAVDDLKAKAKADAKKREADLKNLLDRHEKLRAALAELEALDPAHFAVTAQKKSDRVVPSDQLTPTRLADEHAQFGSKMFDLIVKGGAPAGPQAGVSASLVEALLGTGTAQTGRPGFTPQTAPFVLGAAGVKKLSSETRKLLQARGIDLTVMPVDRAADLLQAELAKTSKEIERATGHPTKKSLKRIGDALVEIETPLTSGWGAVGTGGLIAAAYVRPDGRVPHTRGTVRSSGVADLLIVRQQLTGYEGADVGEIENVLKGEFRSREHSRRQETVLTTFTETETTTDKEQEHEATDRFEMAKESSSTIKEDIALKAGAKVSGKYGPVVEFAVSAEGSYARSKEEATKSATKFAHDVTDRSSLKIAQRVLQRTSMTSTLEVTDKNAHEFDNKTGPGNVAGVYQWVNKIYQAQLFNYGLRAMYDFMIPEPGAFVTAVMAQAHASLLKLTKPPDFDLLPSQIDENNYGYWAHAYRATDVSPPPDLFRTVSFDFKAGGGEADTNYNHSGQVTLEDGYEAVWTSVGAVWTNWGTQDGELTVVVGQKAVNFLNSRNQNLASSDMAGELGSVPVALQTWNFAMVAVAIEIKCRRTDRAMEKWRLDTHGKLMLAYQARLSEYQESLSQLQAQAGSAIRGKNPAANRITIEDELKKDSISILTDQHYELFDAIDNASTGLPEIDIFEAAGEGPYVRFFEQAFEWEHMSWVTYPYFWGRKDQWDERISYEDADPAFNDFLRAGYARVTVPVRPGFETAVDHFLTTGELWNGGPLPHVHNKLYLPIADELAEQLGRPGKEVPQGIPWPVRVPTTLVHLRPDDKLPKWTQNAQGDWVESP